jgi:hypothetical protein
MARFASSLIFGSLFAIAALVPSAQAQNPGKRFFAIQNVDDAGAPVIRGRAFSGGVAHSRLVLRTNTNYREWILDPEGLQLGVMNFSTGGAGSSLRLGRFKLFKGNYLDTDADRLSELAEFIIGTDPSKSDTDDDGILDGAEILQGSDPLVNPNPDGTQPQKIARLGIIAAAQSTGISTDVATVNGLAITANGSNGITVFDITSGVNPTRLTEVDTPGNAVAVAGAGSMVAVADYHAGVALVRLMDLARITIERQVSVGSAVVAVTSSGPVVYVGTENGRVVAIDTESGLIMEQKALASTATVQDLTIWRDTLYALQVGRLTSIGLGTGGMLVGGTLNVSGPVGAGGRRWRLFAGEGTLFASHATGFNIIDIRTNPIAPSLVQPYNTSQFGWKQMIGTGSGLGIAVSGPNSTNDGSHDVHLYTLGSDEREPAFATTFVTPGLAAAASIYNGLAYVADSASGLQVINYKAYDSQGVAPSISLASNGSLDHVAMTGGVLGGQMARFSALVNDDVQVRNVEFWLNGQLATTDGNYPFEHRFIAPLTSETGSSVKIKAKATDTGGNFTWTSEYTLALLPEVTPPSLTNLWPANDALLREAAFVYAGFSESMKAESLVEGFTVTSAGDDGVLDTGDDSTLASRFATRDGVPTVFLNFIQPLPRGLYRIRVGSPATDLAGNSITANTVRTFRVISDQDSDGDGVPDDWEILLGYNPDSGDSDGDSILDGDEDYDNDGVANRWELGAMGADPRVVDSDGDGILDKNEDQDADGYVDWQEAQAGTSLFAADTDGDGFDDGTEIAAGWDPLLFNRSSNLPLASAAVSYVNGITAPLSVTSVPTASAPASFVNAPLAPLPEISIPVSSLKASFKNTPPASP